MKKEIPRLLKSASIVYAFDCIGTVFSDTPFYKTTVLFNPDVLDIRWMMIIPDSFWSYIKALFLCIIKGVHPVQIVRCPKWKLKSNNLDSLVNCLMGIPEDHSVVRYLSPEKVKKINKIYYINNNLRVDDFVNSNVNIFKTDVIAMNVLDFWQNNFSHLI